MGVGKEWAVAGVLGVATFAAFLALDPAAPEPGDEAAARGKLAFDRVNSHRDPVVVPAAIARAWGVQVSDDRSVLAFQPALLLAVLADGEPCPSLADITHPPVDDVAVDGVAVRCPTPSLALLRLTGNELVACVHDDCHVLGAPVALVDGPRLGWGGYNGTRVTVHAFDARGELVFSNGDEAEQARLTRTLTPTQLPTGVWYLGANATAPPGTQKPPLAAQAFLPQVRHLIEGLPVGGVATTQTDALATWYGTLFVTLRVDELVHAP